MIRSRAGDAAALERLDRLWEAGRYEELEAEARALEAEAGRLRGRERRRALGWYARAMATAAACDHGRRAGLLAELESLVAELREASEPRERQLLLLVRNNRTVVLAGARRYGEAEAEGLDILRDLNRVKHLARVWNIELSVLGNLVPVLCAQGRPEEAEAVARGNLPRAEEGSAAGLHCGLVRSLNGQGRYEEALTEARRTAPPRKRGQGGSLYLVTAEALHGLGRRSEAEAAVRRALSDCERSLHPEHPRIRDARTLLAEITDAQTGL